MMSAKRNSRALARRNLRSRLEGSTSIRASKATGVYGTGGKSCFMLNSARAAVCALICLTTITPRVLCAEQVGNLTVVGVGYSFNASEADNPFDDVNFNAASAIAVTADGAAVYVGGERGGLAHLSRRLDDGSLTLVRTWSASDFDEALQSVEQILISPDGERLLTLGARGPSTGTFGLFRSDHLVYPYALAHAVAKDGRPIAVASTLVRIQADGGLDLLQEDDHRGIIRASFAPSSSRDLYAIDDDRNALTHFTYDHGRFVISQTTGGFTCIYGLGVAPDGLNVYVTDDCLYVVTNYKRDRDTGSLTFQDELRGSALNGDGLGCLKALSFSTSGVWAVGLDSCDHAVSILKRDSDTGTLTPISMVTPSNPSGNRINVEKIWSALVISDGPGDIYVADWADRHILWMRANFGEGGDGSVTAMTWFSVSFRPSALAVSPTLDMIYAANRETMAWRGGILSRVAEVVERPEPGGDSGVDTTLALALSLSLLAALVMAGVAARRIARKRNIDKYANEEEALRATLAANPKDAVAHNNLGYIMETVYKDYKEAEAHYMEALNINPRAAFAHNSLGHLLHHRHKNFEQAEEHYRKAISLHWRSPDAHYNLGCLLQHQKDDLVEAERQYRHAVKCDPSHGMAQYNLGWVLEKVKNDLAGAEQCYRAAIQADPDDRDASRRLAKVLAQMDIEAKATEDLQDGIKEEAKRPARFP